MWSPRAVRRTGVPVLHPQARFRVRFGRSLTADTGQAATFTRASTSTALDSTGASVTVGYGRPRAEIRAWTDTAVGGLRMTTDDLTYPLDWRPEKGTLYVAGINLGTAQASGGGLVYLGADAGTGNRLVVRGTGSTFAVDLVSGANTSTATLPVSVANGARFELAVQVDDDGTNQRVRCRALVVGAGSAWSAWGSSIARAATWAAGSVFRLNRVGSAGTQGDVWLREVAWEAGLFDVHEIAGRL